MELLLRSILLCLFKSDKIVCNSEIASTLVGYIQVVNFVEGCKSFLQMVCIAGNADVVRILLERGASFSPVLQDPLRIASRNGYVEVVKLLLGWNANGVRISQENVNNALKEAVSTTCDIEVIRLLIAYGASVDALNMALYKTVNYNRVEIAALLLANGAQPCYTVSGLSTYPLVYACR